MLAKESQEGSLYIWELSDIAQLFALAGKNHKTLPRLPPSHEYGGYKIPIPLHYRVPMSSIPENIYPPVSRFGIIAPCAAYTMQY